MSFTLGGLFAIPATRFVSVLDEQVLSLQAGDVRLTIAGISGSAPRLLGLDGASDGRIIVLYNGTGSTTIAIGPSTTNLNDYVINGNFTLNPRCAVLLRYSNEG